MQADFLDAHERHWDDAEFLFSAQRWANADHLYGISAECGLKRLMLAFNMPFDTATDRPSRKADQKHANGIWPRYESYRSGHQNGTGFSLTPINPFDDWDVSQRYANQQNLDQARATAHRTGANEVRALVRKAIRQGLI